MSLLKSFFSFRNVSRASNLLSQKCCNYATKPDKLVDVQLNPETGYSVVTMQRPPVNGLNLELINELLSAFMSLEKAKSRGMILTSASPAVFSAGLDIMEMYKPNQDRLKVFWSTLQDMWLQLFSSTFPTVAVVNGNSPAGGCLLACSCEYRIMVDGNFTIGLNETQLGIVAPSWFIDSFRAVVPPRITELALMEGKLFTVPDALNIGLIDDTAKNKEEGIEKAVKFLNRFRKISPSARAHTKFSLRYDAIQRLQDGREQDLKAFLSFVNLPEVQKGLDLYMQELKKRAKN